MGLFSDIKSGLQSITPGKELAKGLGYTFALPGVNKIQQQVGQRQRELNDRILEEYKEARRVGDANKMKRLEKAMKLSGNVNVMEDVLKDAPTNRQVIASSAELALFATLGFKPSARITGTSNLIPGLAKFGKPAIQTLTKGQKVLKYGATLGKEAIIGGSFGAMVEAQNKDATTEDIVKSAETWAMMAPAFVVGGTLGGKALGFAGKKIGQGASKLVSKIERVATGEVIGKGKTQLEKTLSYIGQKVPFKQKVAQTAMKGVTSVRKLKMRTLDRFHPLKRMEEKLFQVKGSPLAEGEKIYRDARILSDLADAKAEKLVSDYTKNLNKYNSRTKTKAKAYLVQLDLLDRAKSGQKVAGGQSLNELKLGLKKLLKEIGPEDMKGVAEIRQVTRDYHINLLDDRLNSGLISKEARDGMIKAHPNYIPHNVIMDMDERLVNGISQSLNVSQTDIQKAVGSVRNIDDPFVAMTQRTPIASRTIEKNNLLNNMVKSQEKYNAIPGMKGLQTAERVTKRREIFSTLKTLKSELKKQLRILKSSKKTNRVVLSKIKGIEDDLLKIETQFGDEFTRFLGEGKKITKKLPKTQFIKGTGKLPSNLREIGDDVNKFKNFDDLMASNTGVKLEGLYENGVLERNGFKDAIFKKGDKEIKVTGIKQFFNFVKKPFKELPVRESTSVLKGKVDKLIKLTKGDERLRLEKEILENVDLLSTEDAVRFFTNLSDDIKSTRKDLWLEAQTLSKLKPESGMGTINLYREGIEETWQVPDDIAIAIKNMDAPATSGFWNLVTTPQRILKNFATKYNLSFALPNKLRDKQTAILTSQGFIDDLAKKYELRPAGVVDDISKLTKEQVDELYKTNAGFGSASIFKEGEAKAFNKLEKSGIAKKMEYANPAKMIETINETLEQSTRKKVFKQALEQGLDIKDAILVSRDASIDFAKMGTWMRPVNQAVPFLNARVQGFANMAGAVTKNPEMFARMQLYTSVYPTMALHQHNRRFESYANINQYYKNKYWVIMTGEEDSVDSYTGKPIKVPQFITLPKGEGQALVSGPIQHFLEKADGTDKRTVSRMIADTLGSASPLEFQSFDNSNFFGSALSQLGPGVSVPVGLFSNKHPYFGTDIVPESRKDAPPELQFSRTTPQITKDLGKIAGISPSQIDFAINSFGGLAQDLQDGLDMVYGVVRGDKLGKNSLTDTPVGFLTQTPIARRFIRESGDQGAEAKSQGELKKGIQTDIKGKQLNVYDAAEEIWNEMNKMEDKNDRLNYLNSLGDELTPEIKKRLMQLKSYRNTVEVLNTTDSVELRARYILERIDEMKSQDISHEERTNWLNKLERTGILSKKVKQRIAQLKNQ